MNKTDVLKLKMKLIELIEKNIDVNISSLATTGSWMETEIKILKFKTGGSAGGTKKLVEI